MNQHGSLEITLGEHLRDVREMAANRVPAVGVLRVVSGHLDGSSGAGQSEMVGRLVVIETHHVIPAGVDARVVRRTGRGFLSDGVSGARGEEHQGGRDG